MIPTAKFIADFHRQVIAHAGRTYSKGPGKSEAFAVFVIITSLFLCAIKLSSIGHSRESGYPVFFWIPGRASLARNDNLNAIQN
jgi:hypothetical protein